MAMAIVMTVVSACRERIENRVSTVSPKSVNVRGPKEKLRNSQQLKE